MSQRKSKAGKKMATSSESVKVAARFEVGSKQWLQCLLATPVDNLKQQIAEDKAKLTERDERELSRLAEEQTELIIKRLQAEATKEYAEKKANSLVKKVVDLQTTFNETVDNHQKLKEATSRNRQDFKKAFKVYSDKKKKVDDHEKSLKAKADELDDQKQDAERKLAEAKKSVESLKEVAAAQRDLLSGIQQKRISLASKVKTANKEDLQERLHNLKLAHQERKLKLAELIQQKELTKEQIIAMKEKKTAVLAENQKLEIECNDSVANLEILEQRIANEKKLVEQTMIKKFERAQNQIEASNYDLAAQLNPKIDKKESLEEQITSKTFELEVLLNEVKNIEQIKDEKLKVRQKAVDKAQATRSELKAQENVLSALAEELEIKEEKCRQIDTEAAKKELDLKDKLGKLKKRLASVGLANDSSTGPEESSNLDTTMSSSFSDVNPFEKLDLNATFDALAEPQSSKTAKKDRKDDVDDNEVEQSAKKPKKK